MPGWSIRTNPVSLIFLASAMSTDAFAAAIGRGSSLDRPRLLGALRIGIIFGMIKAITPLVGWLLGQAASQFIANWDHWITFVLLVLLGLHTIHGNLCMNHATEQGKPGQHSFWILAVTALTTSIDAPAVDVGLAFVGVNISLATDAIGLTIMTMVILGTMLGRALGAVTGKRMEMVGGVVLILVGAAILYGHPHAA